MPRILFAISDTGSGHRSGAVAISAAIQQLGGPAYECHIVDILARTGMPIVRDAPQLFDQLSTRWLPLFNLIYQATDGRRRVDTLTQLVYLGAHRNLLHVLNEVQPDLVVSVHAIVNRMIGYSRSTYRLPFRFLTVVTDLVTIHAAWSDPQAELCIVPTAEAYERLSLGPLPHAKLLQLGFPVHPKFAAYERSQAEAQQDLGVAGAPFTVLITSGGVGSGNLRDVVLDLRRSFPDIQLLVVTGRNTALYEDLVGLKLGATTAIFGFVDNMEALMAAADVVVTKAGPGTLMEALVMRRPVIVTQAVGPQERGNIDFVLNHEFGAYCPTIDRITPALTDLMRPEIYAATVERLNGAVPRDGALQIARALMQQLELAPPARRSRLRQIALRTVGQLRTPHLDGSTLRRLPRRALHLRGLRTLRRAVRRARRSR